ncbi:polyhydroxyalkanoate synthesis repressor PhaR [Candidatus Magnetaquicoccus inordinatus]|uniref:polyhydroxyalkanoate synthesis repressor PhaR n=1 Tax=Candidatus Magnetaquicoccus inordinatus TaxID=2496818 RepID=UPI00102B59AD|nr:polyhydroxyalkanoate synthesis repressor PhaR [Candidatus Magnetaquicoccus inordinatus]
MRVIRKYPNRRLYDTERSAYVTLEGIRQLVLDKIPFQVIDKQTNEDITRSILLQIISESEGGGVPVFSTEVLQQIIRFYGGALQGMLGEYLARSVALFVEQQNQLHTAINPVSILSEMTQKNIEFWVSLLPITRPSPTSPPADESS